MTSRPNEAAIDEIVASCNGDVHGALKALLLVNEQLEAELQHLYAAVALGAPLRTRQQRLALAPPHSAAGSFSGQASMVERATLASSRD